MKKNEKGFTLIELMAVLVILGILGTIVVVNVAPVFQRANLEKIKADIAQTEKALEEHEKLVQEKKKLMKYIVVTKSKTEKELGSLQKQLQAEKEQTSFLSSRVDILSESQAEAENTSK